MQISATRHSSLISRVPIVRGRLSSFRVRGVRRRLLEGWASGRHRLSTSLSAKSRTAISAHNDKHPPSMRRPCPAGIARGGRNIDVTDGGACQGNDRRNVRSLCARDGGGSWRSTIDFAPALSIEASPVFPLEAKLKPASQARPQLARATPASVFIRRCAFVVNRHGSMIRPPKAPHEP